MHTFAIADTGASADAWACVQASQSLSAALVALDVAGSALLSAAADAAWDADGVRSLRTRLLELQSGAVAEVTAIETARDELGAIVA